MTNRERFLRVQASYNKRMATRVSRERRAFIVRVVFFAGAGFAILAGLLCLDGTFRAKFTSILAWLVSFYGARGTS